MVCGCCCQDDESGRDDAEDTMNPLTTQKIDFNSRSSFVHKMIDVGLLAANFAQLRVLLSSEQGQFYHVTLVFVSLSMLFQAAFFSCMIGVCYYEYKLEECYGEDQSKTNTDGKQGMDQATRRKIKILKKWLLRLNIAGFLLVALVVVLNVGICALGFGGHNSEFSDKVGETKFVGVVNGSLQVLN